MVEMHGKYSKGSKKKSGSGIKAFKLNPSIRIEEIFEQSAKYQRELEIKAVSSINTYEDRTTGSIENGPGPGLVACKAAGINTGADICLTTLKLTNKNINVIGDTPARRNGIKTAIRQAIIDCNELGLLAVPDSDLKGLRLEPTRQPEPVNLPEEDVEYVRKSRKGDTPFESLRNDIICELELLRAVRPGMEIIMIDDTNVHPEFNYFEFVRDDGVKDRAYVRRDLSDKMLIYRKMRNGILKRAHAKNVRAFFIRSEPREEN
jgi:hypothetical protein